MVGPLPCMAALLGAAPLIACSGGGSVGLDCPPARSWFQVPYDGRLPVCEGLVDQPIGLCHEADHIARAGGAWAENGVPFTLWQPQYTETLTWLGSPRCATTAAEAMSIAAGEGDFGGVDASVFEPLNEHYDQGKWYTLREEISGLVVRLADCDTVS